MNDLEIELAELKIKYGQEVFARIRLKAENQLLQRMLGRAMETLKPFTSFVRGNHHKPQSVARIIKEIEEMK